MPNEKLVSTRGTENLLKSDTYRLYYELKQEILKEYPPQKERTRQQHLDCMKRIGDLVWEVGGHFQQFIWEQMSEQDVIEQTRRAENKKPGGKKPGPKPRYEDINE
jgi:hypothetical protein